MSGLRVISSREWRAQAAWRDRWLPPAGVEARVREILDQVRREGDRALLRLTAELDQVELPGPVLTEAERAIGARACPPEVRAALEQAHTRILAYHSEQRWEREQAHGSGRLLAGPVRVAGIYVPGGRASYPSSVLMGAVPARVAGVETVVLATPPDRRGLVSPLVLAAAEIAGVDLVVRCGGAQAIAALAFGTQSVPRADRIVGPGNVYVTLAKQLVMGAVGIDGLAGPSEILIVADSSAEPELLALDLAAQLEHDPLTWAILLTPSPELAETTAQAFAALMPRLQRRELVEAASLEHAAAVVCVDLDEAVELAEAFAPEHLQVLVAEPAAILPRLGSAGATFVGRWTPVPLGDYAAGPNHTLPTGGAARFASALSVHDFVRRRSVLEVGEGEFREVGPVAATLARAEGLQAHELSLRARLEDNHG